MPYVAQDRREVLLKGLPPDNAGELNYLITGLLLYYYHLHGGRYQQINDCLGALEGAKLEFYRRLAAPYEDVKIEQNGDIKGYGPQKEEVRADT